MNTIAKLEKTKSDRMPGVLDVDGEKPVKQRSGDCPDCIAPPIVGFDDANDAQSSSNRMAKLIQVNPGDPLGPCDLTITQSDCVPSNAFGYTLSITIGGGNGGGVFVQTCFYDGATFDYAEDVCYANKRGSLFNFHGPMFGTIIDYFRNVPGGTTHFITNVDVNAPPTYPQELIANYDDIALGVGVKELDRTDDGKQIFPTKQAYDMFWTLTRTRFSHTRIDWYNFGLGDLASNHTGYGEAYLARNNYVN